MQEKNKGPSGANIGEREILRIIHNCPIVPGEIYDIIHGTTAGQDPCAVFPNRGAKGLAFAPGERI